LARPNGERVGARREYVPQVIISLEGLQDSLVLVRGQDIWSVQDRVSAMVRPLVGLALLLVIHAIVKRNPWPRPFRLGFAGLHAGVAAALVVSWIVLSRLLEALFLGWGETVPYESEYALIGTTFYLISAGILYSVESTARAARAESAAAQTQLAALRAQLHPHFLFNALHTVVQLIPVNPTLAMEAAEIVAELLRSSLEETRDQLPLADEWRFVSRYLTMERMRFGDRLVLREDLPSEVMQARVPAFAVQTLVENAVRHGAAPRVAATEIRVRAIYTPGKALSLSVRNSGSGQRASTNVGSGSGLARLRERLTMLYGNAATLTYGPDGDEYEAMLVIPQAVD
jgi:two-component system LytT family sensor kinase